ncbi:MAG: flagellar hook-basal body complex protein, partial [Defluviitaleaceae bacterium]|nr:flagellar hook-basal body complex protein [Defluviitaleaceae bacterium]
AGAPIQLGRIWFDEGGSFQTFEPAGSMSATPPTPGTQVKGTFLELGSTSEFHHIFGRDDHPADPLFGAVPPTAPSIRMDFSGLFQRRGNTNAQGRDVDGREPGMLNGISVGEDGVITGVYSNGQEVPLWQIAVARFSNPAGLRREGNNMFAQTRNSGPFDGIGFEPASLGARLLGGTLEMSNVDLSYEFTEMITTQRGFQANSRIISTSDEMLQELVNLRR